MPLCASTARCVTSGLRYCHTHSGSSSYAHTQIVVPSQFVTFNLSAIVGSAILYGDFKRASFHQIVTFLYGCAATFAGVFIIAWAPSMDTGDVLDEEDEEASIMSPGGEGGLSRDARIGSLSRRDRPTLIIPEGIADSLGPAGTPILRNRQSLVSMIGLSPAQVRARATVVSSMVF